MFSGKIPPTTAEVRTTDDKKIDSTTSKPRFVVPPNTFFDPSDTFLSTDLLRRMVAAEKEAQKPSNADDKKTSDSQK